MTLAFFFSLFFCFLFCFAQDFEGRRGMSIGLIRSTLTHLELKKSGKRRHSEKGKEQGQDVGLSIRSVPLGFCPRESSVRGALWGPVLESHRIEQQPGPWITEGLSWPHLCQECAIFVPNFGLNLIPRWLGHFGEHSSGPFGLMIVMRGVKKLWGWGRGSAGNGRWRSAFPPSVSTFFRPCAFC